MPDPIQYSVTEALVSAMQNITVANGYHNDVEEVLAAIMSTTEYDGVIRIVVGPGRAEKQNRPTNKWSVKQKFELLGFINVYTDETNDILKITRLIADMEKAALADTTLGGAACDVWLDGNDIIYSSHTEPVVVVSVDITVLYRHSFDNPNTNV